MTTSTTVHPAFSTVLKNAQVREEAKAEAARQQRVQEEQRAQRAAEQAARDAERARLRRFEDGFMYAVANHADRARWSEAAVRSAYDYCQALVSTNNVLPQMDPSMAEVIHGKFSVGMYMQHQNAATTDEQIPNGYYVGQRQSWYVHPAVQARGVDDERIRFTHRSIDDPRTSSRQQTPPAAAAAPLPSAITPRRKKGHSKQH